MTAKEKGIDGTTGKNDIAAASVVGGGATF